MSPPLIACVPDLTTTLGIALQLMSVSDVHRSWTVADCVGVDRPGVLEVETALALRASGVHHPLPAHALRGVG